MPTRKRKENTKDIAQSSRYFYGATYLFDKIANGTGLLQDLKACFGEGCKQILSIAYYLILEDKNPLSRFGRWAMLHKHPHGKTIASQRSSELFASITEDAKNRFFRLQAKRRAEEEYWAYDTTSISRCSKCLKQVKYGMNKEHDLLAQINLAVLFGEESNLPFYYRKLAGNIPDVKTLKKLLSDMSFLGIDKVKLVMDRGFYSADNISGLYKEHVKFLIAGKLSLKIVQNGVAAVKDNIKSWKYYSPLYNLYARCLPVTWDYTQERPYKKDVLKEERRMYLHIYYSPERATEKENAFNVLLTNLQSELVNKETMQDNNLFKDYTMQELLDELDIIECFELSGKRIRIGEMTKKQIQLYEKLGIEPPTSLQ